MDTNGHTILSEDYCSYELAKLLKEKGFDEPCRSAYIWNTEEYELCDLFSKPLHFNREGGLEDYEDDSVPRISAPTHQMAMKWLREEKNIIVNVWYNGVDWDAEYYNNEDENFYLITDSSCNSYEEAIKAALKYVLENLI